MGRSRNESSERKKPKVFFWSDFNSERLGNLNRASDGPRKSKKSKCKKFHGGPKASISGRMLPDRSSLSLRRSRQIYGGLMAPISGGTVKFGGRKWCNHGDVPSMLPDRSSVSLRRSRRLDGFDLRRHRDVFCVKRRKSTQDFHGASGG